MEVKQAIANSIQQFIVLPASWYFEGAHRRTYFAWLDNDGRQCVSFFDHDKKEIQTQYLRTVGDDDHSAPSILIRNDEHLVVFLPKGRGHSEGIDCVISTNPEDISAFGSAIEVDESNGAYPRPYQNGSGQIGVIYRYAGRGEYVIKSDDDGETWGTPQNLVDFGSNKSVYGALYQEIDNADMLHYACIYWDGVQQDRFGLWYMRSIDGGANWCKIDGTSISLPVSPSEMDLVWSTQTIRLHDVVADKNHAPHILVCQPIHRQQTNRIHRIKYESGSWVREQITPSDVFYYNPTAPLVNTYTAGGCIDPKNPDIVVVAAESGLNVDMQKWQRINGSWSKVTDITKDTPNWCIRPHYPRNYNIEFELHWCYGMYSTFGNWNMDLFYLSEP